MAKLVVLTAGMTGLTQEIKGDRVTIGRTDDNTFPISEPSISSHHCEILLRGREVIVRDLHSTNGTFIDGEEVTERVIKPGQVLRLGQVEMRLETETPVGPAKKPLDRTTLIPRGVSSDELGQSPSLGKLYTKGTGFSKKEDKIKEVFIIVTIIVGVGIMGLLLYVFKIAGK